METIGRVSGLGVVGVTHRPLSSSFLGLPYRILNINHKKELLRGRGGREYGVSCFRVQEFRGRAAEGC